MTSDAGLTAVQEAAPVQGAVDPNAAAPAEGATQETPDPQKEESGKAKTGDPRIDDPWPNSARNKVSRLEKKLAIERAERAETARRLQALEAAQQKQASQSQNKAPAETDFENYGEFLQAQILHKLKSEQGQGNEKPVDPREIQQQAFQQAQEQFQLQQRAESMSQLGAKTAKEVPDYAQTIDEYADVLDSFPEEIVRAFYFAENAPMAMYALAKEGKLEQLAQMNPIMAAHEISRAQIRGEEMVKAAKVSKAPPPINGVKGANPGSGGISPSSSYADIKKWLET